ncbi:MAG: aspartate--tRNA ligase [Christensenellales bacterium]
MGELLGGWQRTHYCAELGIGDEGKNVTLMGWVQRRRDLGKIVFLWLRDRTGIVQVVLDGENPLPGADKIRGEFVLAIKGIVSKRSEDAINPKLKTGEIEVLAKELKVLNEAETPPIYIEDNLSAKEEVRLKYRYLDLRRPEMQAAIMLRHRIVKSVRDYLDKNGFLEIETPILGKSSPEGARDYLVPSRVHPGSFYALPQSPQLFKQLLMVSGFDRYFQIARCFRDEDLRADRQPEFTQIDIETSFLEPDEIMAINEGLVKTVFKETLGIDIETPFLRMPYKEAMKRYGSDKPDTRFGMELFDVSDLVKKSGYGIFCSAVEAGGSVRALCAPGGAAFTRKEIAAMEDVVKTYRAKGLGYLLFDEQGVRSPLVKFLGEETAAAVLERAKAKPGDAVFLIADAKNNVVFDALGQLRLYLGRMLKLIDENSYNLLWVTEFPLLEYDEEEKRFTAVHHPFTSPMDEDIAFLESDPGRVRAKAYDIILNGCELGGGSVRIHDAALQAAMFRLLGFTKERAQDSFGYLMEAFRYGAPPHAGIAYGLDRLCMLLAKRDSIRDVIAFPKVQTAADLMTGAPGDVEGKQLDELCIAVTKKE